MKNKIMEFLAESEKTIKSGSKTGSISPLVSFEFEDDVEWFGIYNDNGVYRVSGNYLVHADENWKNTIIPQYQSSGYFDKTGRFFENNYNKNESFNDCTIQEKLIWDMERLAYSYEFQ